jgi:precorrin-8X/cobalt-precorrin-8 methylmutase
LPTYPHHPILRESFSHIDAEYGPCDRPAEEYALLQRVIHSTADFDYRHRLVCSPGAIAAGMEAIAAGVPILTDVDMVRQGIRGVIGRTFANPLFCALDFAEVADPGRTRTETGLLRAIAAHPQAIVVIGNAPTALLALVEAIAQGQASPALVIGVPVGFVAVVESKQALAALPVPQIRVEGRKGGSPVAAALTNALAIRAWEAI